MKNTVENDMDNNTTLSKITNYFFLHINTNLTRKCYSSIPDSMKITVTKCNNYNTQYFIIININNK